MKTVLICLFMLLLTTVPLLAEQNEFLTDEKEKEFVLPLLLNFLPGFGIGSYLQGDTTGGTILLIGDIVGYGLLGTAFLCVLGSIFWGAVTFQFQDWYNLSAPEWMVVIGGSIFVVSKLFGIIRPIWFGVEYNENLKRKKAAVDVSPVVEPAPDGGALKFGLKIHTIIPL
ncbi:MAG TPA: P13 family porin [Spirochaetia bacterium]|nr:P13 family porin [Spirochaetia bacterium]